jgi:hypothetical protein
MTRNVMHHAKKARKTRVVATLFPRGSGVARN